MFNINRTQRTSASEQQSQQQQQHQQQHQQQQHDQSSQLHQETRQPHHQQHQHHQQQLEQSQRNIRSGDDSTPNHSPTSPDQPEVYIRERRHHRNTSCRNRRNQDLSPRFEDDRNIIYLHDGNTRHYRSQNHLNDPSGFWLQRSASARNIRLRSGLSHNHLHQLNVPVDERFTDHIRRSFHDRSNGLSQDALVERQNLVLVPMFGLLRPRRSRNRTHRLSADLENTQQRRQLELDVSSFRNLNNSLSSPLNDDPGDRPIIFTNPTNRNPLQQPLTLNTAQTLSLRSPNEDTTTDRGSQIIRSQARVNSVQTSRATQVVQTRGPYQGQLRRVQNDAMPNRYNEDGSALHDSVVSHTNRLSGIQSSDNNDVNSNNNNNNTDNRQTNVTSATHESPNNSRDREIYVLRNNPSLSQPVQPSTVDNASMTTSISDASSIEDLHVTEIVANSHNESLIQHPQLCETSSSETERIIKSQEVQYAENRPEMNDWRANLIGSRQLWRQMLISERFADVWFIVGGEDILSSTGPLSLHSNDPGAPGGPTSQISCCSNKQMLNVSTRSSNFSSNGVNKSRIMYSSKSNTNNSNTAATVNNNNNNNNNNNGNNNSQVQNDYFDAIHSRCSDSDQENTIDDATDLNSDSEQISCQSDLSKERIPRGVTNKMNESTSQIIRNKDIKPSYKTPASSSSSLCQYSNRLNSTNGCSKIDVCRNILTTGSLKLTDDTDPLIWRFAAHRLILAAASPVFEAMFYGPMADCDNKGSEGRREYHIPDIHPKAFQIMLSYIYSDELLLENDLNLLFYVLYATKKYILPRLTQICVEHLKDLITAENVCMMLERSIFFDEVDLTRRCWHVIDVLAPDVLASQGLLTLNSNYLQDLVRRDTLNCQESEVFAAVGRWAGAECCRLGIRDVVCNRVQVAANILPLIRFPTMTLSDFAENVAYSGYLSLEMVRDLFVYITTNKLNTQNKDGRSPTRRSNSLAIKKTDNSNDCTETDTLSNVAVPSSLRLPIQPGQLSPSSQQASSPDPGPFPREPRTGPKLWRCCRFTRTRKHLLSLTASNNHRHTISFSVSTTVFIAGVGIYGSTQVGDICTVHVELKTGSGSAPLLSSPGNGPTNTDLASPIGSQSPDRVYIPPTSRSTNDLTNLISPIRLTNNNNNMNTTTSNNNIHNNNNNNNNREVYSSLWDNTILSRLDEINSPTIHANSSNRSPKKPSTKCLGSKQQQLRSDGTNRVYDIRFDCPVKLIKGRRYYLSLSTTNAEHASSMSTSSTAINSSTSYIGFFGRSEILIHCPSEDNERIMNNNSNYTHHNAKTLSSSPSSIKKRRPKVNKQLYSSNDTPCQQSLRSHETVIFHFHDSWDGIENGDVDRGLIPDLLFYTCF